jgi:hypothetical protein
MVNVGTDRASVLNFTLEEETHKISKKPLENNAAKSLVKFDVIDSSGKPVPFALATINATQTISLKADKKGHIDVYLSEGEYTVKVEAKGYFDATKVINVNLKTESHTVFDLVSNNRIFGLPTPVFIIISVLSILITSLSSFFIYNFVSSRKYEKYRFHKISNSNNLFDDNGYSKNNFLLGSYESSLSEEEEELYNVRDWKENM